MSQVFYPPQRVLGRAIVTANQTGITTVADLTGLTVTVSVDASRLVRVTGSAVLHKTISDGTLAGYIVADGTIVGRFAYFYPHLSGGSQDQLHTGFVLLTPTAGSHTYKLQGERAGTGTLVLVASATSPASILVEDLGPA